MELSAQHPADRRAARDDPIVSELSRLDLRRDRLALLGAPRWRAAADALLWRPRQPRHVHECRIRTKWRIFRGLSLRRPFVAAPTARACRDIIRPSDPQAAPWPDDS